MAEAGVEPLQQERLTFSDIQNEMIQMDESGMLKRKFYNGIEFTDRRSIDSKPSPFKDAHIVYEGSIDESKITLQDPRTLP